LPVPHGRANLKPVKHLPLCLLLAACSSGPGPVVPRTAVERKMIGLMEKFDRWDDDGDGELDRAELTAGLQGTEHTADSVISFYDTNRNGRVSLREAQAGYARSAEAGEIVRQRSAR
jgi:hypothetical protein